MIHTGSVIHTRFSHHRELSHNLPHTASHLAHGPTPHSTHISFHTPSNSPMRAHILQCPRLSWMC